MEALTLKHYKEPLLPVKEKDGFGYYGAIQVSLDGEKMQCHVCGEMFQHVGAHAVQKHKLTADQYREKFQLQASTSLISESLRARMKENTLNWIQSLSKKELKEMREKGRKALEATRGLSHPEKLESKNKKGTCPDQLLQKIIEVKKELGVTPSLGEFINFTGGQRYKHLIYKTFGSWKNALKILGMEPKKNTGRFRIVSNDSLLEMLQIYHQEEGKIPTATDCKRGLLPSYETYQRHFGSFVKARELAGIYA